MDAGAICLSRVEALGIEAGSMAAVELRDLLGGGTFPGSGGTFPGSGRTFRVTARAAVLAGGPFSDELRGRAGLAGGWISPTRGTHVALPRERLPTDGAVIFPSPVDGRVMFLVPWPRYTVIGTTDLDASPGDEVRATRAEVRYLLDSANGLAPDAALTEDDVVSTWAGLRPLLAAPDRDPSERSREERIQRDGPIYTIAGGKLTAFRSMAEKIGARLTDELGIGRRGASSPTRDHLLPGALSERAPRPSWSSLAPDGKPALGREPILHAWAKRYGARQELVKDTCMRAQEGLRALDAETLLGEVDWAVRHEDCLQPSDFFLRRTDLGLGPRAIADEAAPLVIERMRDLFGWDSDEARSAADELRESLDRGERWRKEAPG